MVLTVQAGFAQAPSVKSDREQSVREFLRNYLHDPRVDDDKTTQYTAAFVDLNGDGTQEVIVYLSGRDWCGGGGCTTLILSPRKSTYQLVTRITVSRLPIRVLTTKTNGWYDISVIVAGGGVSACTKPDWRLMAILTRAIPQCLPPAS